MLFLVSVEASFPGKGGTRPIFGYKLGLGLADPGGWGGGALDQYLSIGEPLIV